MANKMTSDIPQEILDKIDSDYPMGNGRYSTSFRGYNKMQEVGRNSAKYGYSLALPEIKRLKQENDVLITALSLSNAGRRKLSTQVNELKQENEQLKEDKDVLELSLETVSKEKYGLWRNIYELTEQRKNLQAENEALKQRIEIVWNALKVLIEDCVTDNGSVQKPSNKSVREAAKVFNSNILKDK